MAAAAGSRTCGSCERASENKHFDCPPRMADGRLFTDYRPRCDVNYLFPPRKAYLDSYKYRQYLIHHADEVLAGMRKAAYSAAACGPCVQPFNPGTMLPERVTQRCDARTCSFAPADEAGLGTGRSYGASTAGREAFAQARAAEDRAYRERANCCGAAPDWSGSAAARAGIGRWAAPFGGDAPREAGDPSIARGGA